MAYLNNKLLQLRGMVGGLVFRRVRNKTIVSAAPTARKAKSEKQIKQQERFRQAGIYAKQQMLDPELKAAYEEAARYHEQPNAYNAAISDFFHAPVIHKTQISEYNSRLKICIDAEDDFVVKEVVVKLTDHTGKLLEEGHAIIQFNRKTWLYVSVAEAEYIAGYALITAIDLPGNETIVQLAIPG